MSKNTLDLGSKRVALVSTLDSGALILDLGVLIFDFGALILDLRVLILDFGALILDLGVLILGVWILEF